MQLKDALETELTGSPVTVRLGDKDYPLAFPMYAVALYKQETAKLNYRRAKMADEAGRPRLAPAELRQLRTRYNQLIDEDRKEKTAEELAALWEEIVTLRSRIDEETAAGDSLLLYANWWKIRDDDPERIIIALWCGLHVEEAEGRWTAPFTLAQLQGRKLVNFSNIGQIIRAITQALGEFMPKVKAEENTPKNADRPGRETPAANESEMAIATATE